MDDKQKLYEFLKGEELYLNLTEIPGRGFCAIHKYLYTTGLLYGLDFLGIQGRYCYETPWEACEALLLWDGKEDPPGNWIMHKGRNGEYSNPKYVKSKYQELKAITPLSELLKRNQ